MRIKRMALSQVKSGLSRVIDEIQSEGQAVIVTIHGHDAVRIMPLRMHRVTKIPRHNQKIVGHPKHQNGISASDIQASIRDIDSLAAEIGSHWKSGLSVQEALREVRD